MKTLIDVLLTLTLLFLMGYQFWGDEAHEWAGAGMLALFVIHHILNVGWYKNLFRGRYTPARILGLCVNILLLAAVVIQMYSGIMMSRHVFAFLPVEGGMAVARRLHIIGAYWGFVLMSLHLGLHWNMVIGMMEKRTKTKPSKARFASLFAAGALVAGYGAFVFIKRNLASYLFLQTEFVFLDYGEPQVLFYLDYLALMGLFIFLAHYFSKFFRKKETGKIKGDRKNQRRGFENLNKEEIIH